MPPDIVSEVMPINILLLIAIPYKGAREPCMLDFKNRSSACSSCPNGIVVIFDKIRNRIENRL